MSKHFPDIRSLIKAAFLTKHSLSARELRTHLQRLGIGCSLVTVYAELKLLLRQGMLLKQGTQYLVRLNWLLDLKLSIEKTYIDLLHSKSLLNHVGALEAKPVWTFNSLEQMNDFWVQLIFALAAESKSKVVYESIPHLWFAHLAVEQDAKHQRTFAAAKLDIRIVILNDTALSREPLTRRETYAAYQCKFVRSFYQQDVHSYCVIGEWLITISIPASVRRSFDTIFQSPITELHTAQKLIWRIVQEKWKIKLSLERNTPVARKIRTQFGQAWQSR